MKQRDLLNKAQGILNLIDKKQNELEVMVAFKKDQLALPPTESFLFRSPEETDQIIEWNQRVIERLIQWYNFTCAQLIFNRLKKEHYDYKQHRTNSSIAA